MRKVIQKKALIVEDGIALFLDEKQMENASESTIEFYDQNLKKISDFMASETSNLHPTCRELTLELFNKYRKKLKNKKKWDDHPDLTRRKQEKISDNSYRTYINAVRVWANWLFEKGHIDEDILSNVSLPKKQEKQVRLLSEVEIRKVFNQFDTKTELGLRNYLITWLALDMGLRAKSIVTLKLSKIDFNNNRIEVWLKGNKTAIYPLDKTLKTKLREYILLYRNKSGTKSEALFLNHNGSDITANTIKQLFKQLKEKTGIKEIGCHMLRHNFGTNYILQGNTMEDLQYMLGQTTQQAAKMYVHIAKHINVITKHTSRLSKIV